MVKIPQTVENFGNSQQIKENEDFFFIIPQLYPAKSMTYLVDKESHIIKYLDKFL